MIFSLAMAMVEAHSLSNVIYSLIGKKSERVCVSVLRVTVCLFVCDRESGLEERKRERM